MEKNKPSNASRRTINFTRNTDKSSESAARRLAEVISTCTVSSNPPKKEDDQS